MLGTSPFRSKSRGTIARTPSPPPLPPKPPTPRNVIDLNSSTGSYDRSCGSKVARRAILCDVVVEKQGEEVANVLTELGRPLDHSALSNSPPNLLTPTTTTDERTSWDPSKREEMARRLHQLTEEMLRTERSYVSRIEALQKYYATPLRFFARQGNTVIIPKYHAKTLFGNIDAVLPAAQTFLKDLEELWASGQASTLLGDLCVRHLKTLKTMEPYGTYIGNQDEAQKIFQDLYKNDRSFEKFVDSTKQQTTGIGNIGLRELLMEPVQRIPRYTMLWQSMAKCLPPLSEQRAKLLESIDIASRIARCEADEQTVRATVMYCLQRNIDGIPASIFSNHRNFIDSIDVEELLDVPGGGTRTTPRPLKTAPGTPSDSLATALHCTLFLFDDQLIIAKRPSAATSGRKLTGLDDIAKLVKSGGGVAVKEKDGMKKERLSFRGAIDILKISGMDTGGGDFQLLFDGHSHASPVFADQSERWAGRPLRSYSTIHPPQPVGFDPGMCRSDKSRFLGHLWAAQALCRTRPRHKVVEPVCRALIADDDVNIQAELLRVKSYWNLWDRGGWTSTDRKVKVVIQLTEDEDTPELVLPQEGGPVLVIRLEALPGSVCRLQAVTNTGTPIFRTATSVEEVNDKIVEAINACELFKVRVPRAGTTSSSSTGAFGKRASRFGIGSDIARNLWGNSASSRGASTDAGSMRTSASYKSRSLDASKSTDMLTISSISTNPPKTPKSDRSPVSPTSPISIVDLEHEDREFLSPRKSPIPRSPARSPVPKSPVSRPQLSPIKMHTPLKLPSSPFKSPQGNKTQGNNGQPMVVSRVAAMRQEIERKMNDSSTETLTTPGGSPARQPSPSPRAEGKMRSRVPAPSLAANVFRDECKNLSREPSFSSLSGSPAKGELSRSNTLSPRGPRARGAVSPPAVPRNGYVPPLPPPALTAIARTLPLPPSAPGSNLGPETSHVSRNPSMMSAIRSPNLSDHTSLMSHTGHSAYSAEASGQMEELRELREVHLNSQEDLRPRGNGSNLGLGAPPRHRDENTPAERKVSQKRSHEGDDELLEPRKRSSSGSSSIMARVGSEGHAAGNGLTAVRRGSSKVSRKLPGGVLSRPRHTSIKSTFSVASSLHSLGSAIDEADIVMSDHPDILSASDSARSHLADARKLARRIRMDASTIQKICSPSASSAGGLARSPSISEMMPRPMAMLGNSDMKGADMRDIEELARHVSSAGEKLESHCVSSLADAERVRMLARQVDQKDADHDATVSTLEAQLARAKEREDLLQDQLRRRDLELEEIYNAFNAELDGMYNDVNLPRTDEVIGAMRADLQGAKSARNALDLENRRLKLQLEEEKLMREQWSQLLTARGLLR